VVIGSVAVGSAAGPGLAAETCVTAPGEPVWAAKVVAGDEIELVDGRHIRLASVESPRAPLIAGSAVRREAAAVATTAGEALGAAVEGREIVLHQVGADRHGRAIGHLYDIETGQWIEADLVRAGHLRVVPSAEGRNCIATLLPIEAEARAARRGLWATATFGVTGTDRATLVARIGRWVVVEGRVRSVGHSGGRTWLNFGEDFRRDFAVVMKDKDLDRFRAAGLDAGRIRGWTLRVRGVLFLRDGPRIAVEGPEDIERVKR
jgi:endonuclease YncB( thermonuclease family)